MCSTTLLNTLGTYLIGIVLLHLKIRLFIPPKQIHEKNQVYVENPRTLSRNGQVIEPSGRWETLGIYPERTKLTSVVIVCTCVGQEIDFFYFALDLYFFVFLPPKKVPLSPSQISRQRPDRKIRLRRIKIGHVLGYRLMYLVVPSDISFGVAPFHLWKKVGFFAVFVWFWSDNVTTTTPTWPRPYSLHSLQVFGWYRHLRSQIGSAVVENHRFEFRPIPKLSRLDFRFFLFPLSCYKKSIFSATAQPNFAKKHSNERKSLPGTYAITAGRKKLFLHGNLWLFLRKNQKKWPIGVITSEPSRAIKPHFVFQNLHQFCKGIGFFPPKMVE